MKKLSSLILLCIATTTLILSCHSPKEIALIPKSNFDTILNGKQISLYTLKNGNITLQVTNFGARVITLFVPDRKGEYGDIVLGYENIDRYINNNGERFLGATIGRYGNRIAKGQFSLNDTTYQLATFNNGQCLHGGNLGFDMVVWNVDSVTPSAIYFSYLSPNMEEGFPGNLAIKMAYILTPENEFKITYSATTDKATPINLTHHSFFNLKGEGNGCINNHELTIKAAEFTPVDSVLIPLGFQLKVEGTPFDFRTATAIGKRIDEKDTQLIVGSGYDHNFVLSRTTPSEIEFAASVYEPESGRFMEVFTTEPGIQFYGGNFFDGTVLGKTGKPYDFRGTFALETQHFPDSPNQPTFPNTILQPGETYTQTCIYKFSYK